MKRSIKDNALGFAEMFEKNKGERDLREGNDLIVRVLDINENFVTVDAALKSEARIPTEEFFNSDNEVDIQVGDTVEVEIGLLEDGMGQTRLSRRNTRRKGTWKQLEAAMEGTETVEGKVESRVRGGYTVALDGLRAFLPSSLADAFPSASVDDTLVGQTLRFKPIKINPRRHSVVLSRRAVVDSELLNSNENAVANLQEGQRISGKVKAIVEYGAFVEVVPRVFGLLHITDMSWKHTADISTIMKQGDEVEVVILKVDRERGRISLGRKQLQPDPWDYFERTHPVGTRTFGKVTRILDYGVFVEIADELHGLVHTSEMAWSRSMTHPSKFVKEGDEVEVMVLETNRERRRISLGMKQCKPNPWHEFATAYRKGDKITCKVHSISEYGMFMELPGEIEGLVWMGDISAEQKGEVAIQKYSKGQELETIILAIDPDRERIGLGIRQLDDEKLNQFCLETPKGALLRAKVVSIEDNNKGAVVMIEPEQIRAFLPVGEIAEERVKQVSDHLKVDEELEVALITADMRSRRVVVSVKAKDRPVEIPEPEPVARTTLGDIVKAKIEGITGKAADKDAAAADAKSASAASASSTAAADAAEAKPAAKSKAKKAKADEAAEADEGDGGDAEAKSAAADAQTEASDAGKNDTAAAVAADASTNENAKAAATADDAKPAEPVAGEAEDSAKSADASEASAQPTREKA